ncbi:hypothetical protein FGL01_13460 [Flavobacterium glycines]|nr:T9SS sorting signal type C domain-containing protein [Flavobacterium glycines]OCB71574.1 hypothetical protein FBGL_10075 [Flavobacterium glycines]GEL10607.1 hypothetical protein FGL01_13460 [Flavobacterium glycines]
MRPIFTYKNFLILIVVLFFSIKGFSQCSITTSRTTTGLTCGTSPLNSCGGVLNIGDGTNAMTLTMTSNLDLSCLGPIRFIVRNGASIDFSTGNYDLQLANGSSIEVESGGQIGAGSNCSASDLIKIGSVKVASCTGNSALTNFEDLVNNGGYSSVSVSASPASICNSGSSTLTATASPSNDATIKWYDSQTGGNLLYTGSTYNTGTINSTKTYYVEAVYSGYTTVRKAVTVTVTNTAAPTGTASQSFCSGNPKVSDLTATGTGINWYSVSTGGSALASTTVLTNGTHYYASQTVSGCESSSRLDVTAIVNSSSVAPTGITGTTTICNGNSTTLTLSGGTAGTGAVATWYLGSCGGTLVGTGTSITVSPASTTTYYVRYEGTCNTTSCASTTVVVNPLPIAAGTISGAATVCKGTLSVSYSISTITNATSYVWSYSGTGAVISGTTNNVTISFASGATSGNLTVYGVNACGNGTVSNALSIAVNNVPATPSAGTPTNPTCKVPTGSVPLNGLPTSGTIVQTGTHNDTYAITAGGTQTISSLLPGTYYFSVSNGSCTSNTVTVTIVAPETNTWSTGSWSNGTPTINQRLVFASDYTNANDVDIVGCSCQITGSTAVTIKSGRTLKIENGIDVATTASLTFENNASLVQINDDAVNTGNINYKRYTAAVKRYDFTYWSSPVTPQTLKNLSPNTLYDKYYSYNNGWQIIYNGAATMTAGRGYLVRAPQTFSITVAAVDTNPTFIGTPNNGVVSFIVAGNQVHLLGNPYPSAIDADVFLNTNAAVLEGTLYFWTHNSAPSSAVAGDATYNYTTSDYAIYNRTGGVVTNSSANNFDGKIAAGQGFFAPSSTSGGTLTFNNSMRVEGGTSGVNNSQFFKLNSSAKTSTVAIQKSRIWLNLSNKEGAFKQTLVGYITGATNEYDGGFDGLTYDGNQFVDFYSVNQTKKYTIQGRALPFVKQDSVVLGYKSTIVGEFQISIDRTDGVLATQNVFLEDKDLKVLHDLKKGPYTFTTEKGAFNNRFVLRYTDKNAVEEVVVSTTPSTTTTTTTTEVVNNGTSNSGTTSAGDSVKEGVSSNEVLVSVQDGVITVKSSVISLQTVVVYDTAGRTLYRKEDINASVFAIQQLLATHQVLLVDILMADGTKVSSKIIY